MNKKSEYAGIDYFKIVAAFLVVAIHTSPLLSYSDTGDFILTRIIARVAIPFFFMVSGFFLLPQNNHDFGKLKSFVKKTAIIYCAAIVLYIPINIYNGYFSVDNLLPSIVKDIVFDGTFYHLWYLPAAILGGSIAWSLSKKFGLSFAFFATTILYVIGLLGDSYFGFSSQIPLLNSFYSSMFKLFDYTRNGLFFAPIFFVMGGIAAEKREIISLKKSVLLFAFSFILMLVEGMFLHNVGVQRHDSMYLMLIPCGYFLFCSVSFFKGKRVLFLRNLSLLIYILHPMMIIVVRVIAKLLGLQALFIDNSLLHFIAVCFFSFGASYALLMLQSIASNKDNPSKIYKDSEEHYMETDRSWIEIDLDNLGHNAKTLQAAMPSGCHLMAVVKASGYGHGSVAVAKHLNSIGINAFAVATLDEGIELRQCGVSGEILILGYSHPCRAKDIAKYDLIQTLLDYEYGVNLNNQGERIKIHVKIDTGMHRNGFGATDFEHVIGAFTFDNLQVCGIFTHLCSSGSLDEKSVDFTNAQIKAFYAMLDTLCKSCITLPKVHIQSSYGLLNYPELKCDYARIGIVLYGLKSSSDDETKLRLDLRPVLSLKSQVTLIREIKAGEGVGYDLKFTAARDTRIAILPIGYADGFPRCLSCGKASALVHGRRAPIIGRICMDQLILDITDIIGVTVGDIATLIGKDGLSEISAEEVAKASDSITNELLSRMGRRLKLVQNQNKN